MRTLILAGLLLAAAGGVAAADPPAPPPAPPPVMITYYGDGRSCPGDCDAHVALHDKTNGTAHAHLPGKPAGTFEKCTVGSQCRLCFESDAQSCMDVLYRGSGPPIHRFDFTFAFFAENCPKPDLPKRLAAKCKSLAADAKRLDGRINCIAQPDHAKCTDLIAAAKASREKDLIAYQQCRKDGEAKFNKTQPIEAQRKHGCAYEALGTGKSSNGKVTWLKLLPAACKDGHFVGPYGTDCCSGDPKKDGPMGVECKSFYPSP